MSETKFSLVANKQPQVLMLLLLLGICRALSTTVTGHPQNLCPSKSLLVTRSECRSCFLMNFMTCPKHYRMTQGTLQRDCRFSLGTGDDSKSIVGCSVQCVLESTLDRCCPGYWGPECIECPEEAKRPCNNNGICSDGLGGNGTCSCKPGFSGTACEDCAEHHYGPTCSSVCRCVHGLCDSGIHGDGKCTCFSGYKGPDCDQALPDCVSLSCPENSRCMEDAQTGALVCRCMPGYQNTGDKCTSINPCLQSQICHRFATCAHLGPNKHSCTCGQGYSGDGVVCVPIDPCQNDLGGCSADGNQRCVFDGPGKSHCDCQEGYEPKPGNGGCFLKDLCKPDSCDKNAKCTTETPGDVTCTCLEGFQGNGKICFGSIMHRLNELNTEPGGKWAGQLGSAITLFDSLAWPLSKLGPFTIFVPLNKGFQTGQLKTLLSDKEKTKYLCNLHLVAGELTAEKLKQGDNYYTLTGKRGEAIGEDKQLKIRLYGSRKKADVVQSDIVASNGVIHLISKLMDSVSPTVKSEKEEDLMKVLSDNGKFSQFKGLLQKANMAVMLEGPGPFTLFAPTGTAFDTMKDGHLQYLTSSEGSMKLLELLRYHVVPNVLDVYTVVNNPLMMTQANQYLTINVTENGNVLVNGAAVVLEADVHAKNGRLYSLGAILIPPSIEPLLPHRCDVTENNIVQGDCVSCFKVAKAPCPSGESLDAFKRGCVFRDTSLGLSIPTQGCAPLCNVTVTVPRCCQGFYGPDCSPCPGGFSVPCSGHGQCMDGVEGNGTCVCQPNFKGSRCQYCSDPDNYGPTCDKKCDCIHGECDNRVEADGRCKFSSCQKGFTGKYCERHTRACGALVQFCHAHAECDFNGGAVKCVCKPGYQGDGITCLKADPCDPPHRGGCSEHADCVTTGPTTHTCQCMSGWVEDGDECRAVNPCLLPERGSCQPNANCLYVGPGQSECVCKDGYLGNGKECEAVNQCVTENNACHFLASCRQMAGAWKCVCDDGWMGDGQVCYGNLEQELRSMPGITNFFRIVSDGDISQMLIYQNVTVLVPSTEAVGKMTPDERSYWTDKDNLPSLVRNHMINGIYSIDALRNVSRARITNLLKAPLPISTTNETTVIAGAEVTRSNVMASNGLIHIINKVLIPGKDLSEGLVAVLNKRPEFSLFTSYIVQHNLTDKILEGFEYTVFAPTNDAIKEYLQKTSSQFMPLNLTQYHIVPNQRLLLLDLQGGAYKDTMLGFSYQLEILPRDGKLYVNEALLNVSDIDTVKGVIHGLTSVLEIRLNRCDKEKSKTVLGTCQDCFHPLKKLCDKGAEPMKSNARRKCMFSRMYQGERLMGIGCRTTCVITTIERKCCAGHFGQHCEPCPGLKGKPCFGNGVCVDGTNGTGVCQCAKGFSGTGCETCQAGKYSIHCDQDCACRNGQCSDGLNGDGSCECDVGWRGVSCDEKITSKDDEMCSSIKCHTSASCLVNPDGYKCVCAAGFEGNGTYCKAKDACAENNGGCSPNAQCKRTLPGRRECVCNPGYSGDGLLCVEINPCLDGNGGCHGNAECIHTGPNRTSCVCNQGYSGSGKTCKMINLCLKNKGGCHRYGSCDMTGPGVRTCTCPSGFIGDGLTCKGTVWRELVQNKKLRDFYMGLTLTDVSVRGRGPFTIFAPDIEAYKKASKELKWINKISAIKTPLEEKYANILGYHVVSCQTLLDSDLTTPRNLTTLMGDILHVSSYKGSILINNFANVTFSNEASNGVIHTIDTVLMPKSISLTEDTSTSPIKFSAKGTPASNLSDVANGFGYKTFYKLLEDTEVLSLMQDAHHKPVTVFLPSDATMAALSQDQKDFLYNQHNRPHLLEYLKYHILPRSTVFASELPHLEATRTLQGSEVSFRCGGVDHIGEIYLNGDSCRIIQRHLPFTGGMAYGIDCLLAPPSLGGRCDTRTNVEITMSCTWCVFSKQKCPEGSVLKEQKACDLPTHFVEKNTGCQSICTMNQWSPQCCAGYYGRDCLPCPGGARAPCEGHGRCDDGQLGSGNCTCDPGFQGTACERCLDGRFGAQCQACNCSEHGRCLDGHTGDGSCFCDEGWTGQRCATQLAEGPVCTPTCSPSAVCMDNNTCVCKLFYEGDGYNCTLADLCSTFNGGCAPGAKCSQQGEKVNCSCPNGYTGDGFICQLVDICAYSERGGCHEHAICTVMGPGAINCKCKDDYVGDGLTCEVKVLRIDRCATDNGLCHLDATCTDHHFEDKTLGVFHYRSPKGTYKLNYTQAQEACAEKGATLATYTQLSHAQKAGFNLCSAGWLDGARVSYPTTYSNPKCGFGHIGIVDYGQRKDLSETWDTFCYRLKEVTCECKPDYAGDGFFCVGNLMQVLSSRPTFSNFLSQILNYSQSSQSGREFVNRLSNLTIQSTLFVPANEGLFVNQTLTHRDIQYHLSEGRALALKDLSNGSHIHTRLGHSLTVLGIADFLNPSVLSSRYINDRFVIDSDIPASNGIVHVLQGPLIAPPPELTLPVGHKAGMGIGVVLLVIIVFGVGFVGYHFYTHKTKPFQFHYFKDNEDEDSSAPDCNPSICNPMYGSASDFTDHASSDLPEDKHQVADSGLYDLPQAS